MVADNHHVQSPHVVMRPHHVASYGASMQADDGTEDSGSLRYDIRVMGHLDPRWAAWFDGLVLTKESDGTTIIHGPVVDQAALHGVLQKLRDIGMPLVSVTQVDPSRD